MAFIVAKKIKGREYYYLRSSKREDGKVKAITLAYLGKDKDEAEKRAKEFLKGADMNKADPDKAALSEKADSVGQNQSFAGQSSRTSSSPKEGEEKGKDLKSGDGKKSSMAEDVVQRKKKKGSDKDHEGEKDFLSFLQEAGLIWGPEPEIYGGLAGFYTYGPLGKMLKNKVENSVRKVFRDQGLRELEGPTVLPDVVWKASGHLDTFKDRTIQCSKCDAVFRADKIIEEKFDVPADGWSDDKILAFIEEKEISCPSCKGGFEKKINTQSLMMKTVVAGEEASLRPETATVTYLPYPRFYNYFRKKFPMGVFQIGKAYRNEISPRQHVLRGREFTQAEGQIFVDPEKKNSWERFDEIKDEKLPFWSYEAQDAEGSWDEISVADALEKGLIKSQAYGWCIWLAYMQFVNFGIPKERIRLRQHHPDEKAFYADDAWDIELRLNNYGWTEVCGVHDRTDYDLTQHSKFSGEKMDATRDDGTKFVPHVLEIAFGTDRPTYALIDLFYEKKEVGEGKSMFAIPYHMAPTDVAVFPLMKKPPELVALAKDLVEDLQGEFLVEYDAGGSIGRRYLRAATMGTPYCITVDGESVENETVTVRDRDTAEQIRVKTSEVREVLGKLLSGELVFGDAGEKV